MNDSQFTFEYLPKILILDTSGFFETFFKNAKYNGIIIMRKQGEIININEAFHLRFGYSTEDLVGKNFSVLFTQKDREINKSERELQNVLIEGSANDENYLMHKDGNKVWVTGESVLIENEEDEVYVVKVVHNIHAQKQLERFLIQSHEFIDSIFDSVNESALLMLDSRLRIIKVNHAFIKMFNLKKPPEAGTRLSDINNAFWLKPEVKQEVVNFLVLHNMGETKTFDFVDSSGKIVKLCLQAKIIEGVPGNERRMLIMIK